MSYPKSWKSYSDQLDQLIDRGMAVTDRARALDYLERIGYYRLSGYWFAFRERSEPLCLLDEHGRKPKKVREMLSLTVEEQVKMGRLAYRDAEYAQRLGMA